MPRRRSSEATGAIILFLVVCGVVAAVQLAEHLAPLVLLAGAGYGGWRWRQRRGPRGASLGPSENSELDSAKSARRRRMVQAEVVSEDAARVEQLQAELSRVRRQVADLEDAAGRPVDAITQTYRHLQRQYGPAAAGKIGDQR
jgi:hypothetical protein